MRPVLLLLLVAAAVSCRADFITIRSQPLLQSSAMQGGTVYLVNSQGEGEGEGAPRVMGLLTRLQMLPTAGASQDAAAQAFSRIFSGRGPSFLDGSLSAWVDQQVAALDQLQDALVPPPLPLPRPSGCPRMAAMRAAAAAGAAAMPADALSYMAASRFGPGIVSFTQQSDEDTGDEFQGDLTGADVGEEGADEDADEDADMVMFDAGGVGEYLARNAGEAQDGFVTSAQGRGFMPSMLSEEDTLPGPGDLWMASATAQPMKIEEEEDEDDGPTWFFVFEDGSINWGFIVFLLLCLGVIPIWCLLIRTLVRLCLGKPCGGVAGASRSCPFAARCLLRRQPRAQFVTDPAKAPLLGDHLVPLAPEKPVAEKAAPEFLSSVEIASEQAPHGEYFQPKKNEFVTILV